MTRYSPTIFVIDDDPGVRDSLTELLSTVDLNTRTFATAKDFLTAYDPAMQGCLILDMRMPGMSGLELQRKLASIGSQLPIFFLTAYGDVPTAVQAVQAGAVDFIEKPFQPHELIDKVQNALEEYEQRRQVLVNHDRTAARIASLTPREREVLEMIVEGKKAGAIAEELGIGRRTVEIHRANMMKKMQVDSAVKLVQLMHNHPESPRSHPGRR
jgi:FixJ family two-component response regulator